MGIRLLLHQTKRCINMCSLLKRLIFQVMGFRIRWKGLNWIFTGICVSTLRRRSTGLLNQGMSGLSKCFGWRIKVTGKRQWKLSKIRYLGLSWVNLKQFICTTKLIFYKKYKQKDEKYWFGLDIQMWLFEWWRGLFTRWIRGNEC